MLKIYAAIDLFNGRVARLVKGRREDVTYYPLQPLEYAKKWMEEGADWLHVIDLNAAFGIGNNVEIIREIVRGVDIPVQVGGGVRTLEYASKLLEAGASRVIISSVFFTDRKEAVRILSTHGPEHVIIALDCNPQGVVMIKGWKEAAQVKVPELLPKVLDLGFKEVLVTDVTRDGTLLGVNGSFLSLIPAELRGNVIIAGGVARLGDLLLLSRSGFSGVILGKALYESVMSVSTARMALSTNR